LAPNPRTGLEMTLLRMLAFRPTQTGSSESVSSPAAARPAGSATNNPGGAVQGQADQAETGQTGSTGHSPAEAAKAAFEAMVGTGSAKPLEARPAETKAVETRSVDAKPATTEMPENKTRIIAAEDEEPDWSVLQESLELNGAARELARNMQLESTGKLRWQFLVPDTLQNLGSESVVQSLQAALAAHLGREVLLDLHVASKPLDSVAAAVERTEVSLAGDAERAIQEDATVQEIKEKFGAKVVPDSIQPIQ
jgi:DNA polymerase-3 subunit gamma/tau